MNIKNFINENNIVQKYNIDFINELKDYTNMKLNTIFYCKKDFDFQLLELHKGDLYLYVDNINQFDRIINKSRIKIFLCNNINIFYILKSKVKNVELIKSNTVNTNKIKIIDDKKIIFLINCSLKEQYKDRYIQLYEKLQNFKYDYLILINKKGSNEIKDNILYIDIDDHYENLSKKIYEGIKYIYNNTDYNYIYKVDDDFFNYNINITDEIYCDYYSNHVINSLNREYHFGKCFDKELNYLTYGGEFLRNYAGGGYGYVISRKSMFYIINNKDYIYNEIYEDKAIGDVLYKNNIKLTQNTQTLIKYNNNKMIIKTHNVNYKCAVIMYHKNIKKIYDWRWVEKSVGTILNQSITDFDIFEINYGGDNYSLFEDINTNKNTFFYNKNLKTHTEAMVYLLNKCFYEYNYDVVFNTNLDDFYDIERFKHQLDCVKDGYMLNSTLMRYITDKEGHDIVEQNWTPDKYGFENIKNSDKYIDIKNIRRQLDKDHNVFNHPNMCYTKEFWNSFTKNNILLRYRDDKPFEDLTLWQRACESFDNITIINKILISYRLHANQIGEQNKKNNKDKNVDGGFKPEPDKSKLNIGIICICTGNYVNYFSQFIESVEKYFLTEYKKCYFISTDNDKYIKVICEKFKIKYFIDKIYKKGFPLDTLYRYKYILNHGINVELCSDVVYYLDVDMRILEDVGSEILPTKEKPLIGTYHPGFYYSNNKNGALETNRKSTAYVPKNEYINKYIAGGFNGGITHYFLDLSRDIKNKIDIDKSNDIIATWHDESQLNRYMISNINLFKFMIPDYCYPENYHENIPGIPKILALDKKHDDIRNNFNKNYILVNAMGGLGNLLFQTFFAYNIALRYNLDVAIRINQKDESRESIYFYHMFDNILRIKKESIDDLYEIKEVTKNYSDLMSEIPMNRNLYLNGFFQSSYYFDNNFDRIKKHFNCEIKDIAMEIINKYKSNDKKLVAIHIRGGDYIQKSEYHKLLDKHYYDNCINQINDNVEYILFTDDIEYASENFSDYYTETINNIIQNNINQKYEYLINNPELSFYLMSLFDIIICANSTFSLWASYFGNAEKVFIPKEWFGPKGPSDFTTEEFILNDNYIRI
tara:strand:- start:9596 stop:12895 length:3300 start_codon:yes stop_codon:yes gene_type:complete